LHFTNPHNTNLLCLYTYTNKVAAVFTVHIVGFYTHTFYLGRLLGKLTNVLTQSVFKIAGPGLMHNLHWH